jgi:transketolase
MAALRAIPNWTVIRPADANEAREAWRAAMLNTTGPTAIICTRQKLPILDRLGCAPAEEVHKGAYVLKDAEGGAPGLILMASGSEVSLALKAQKELALRGVKARVVSFPSWELFEKQPQSYRDSVLPPRVRKRIAIEAACPMGWEKWTGDGGQIMGIPRFGASAAGEKVMAEYGFTVDNVVRVSLKLLGK